MDSTAEKQLKQLEIFTEKEFNQAFKHSKKFGKTL